MDTSALVEFVAESLSALADIDRAEKMAAYMKTDMPFYGVQKPARRPVFREMIKQFPVTENSGYRLAIEALWSQAHREEKYFAVATAARYKRYVTFANLDLYERLIIEGAWWDLVDDVAVRIVGHVLLIERARTRPVMEAWIERDDI